MATSVSILIPTHNRVALLCQTVRSLGQIQLPPGVAVDLLVVANACTDDTVARVAALLPALPFAARVIEEPEPGLNPARNRCVVETSGEVCAFLDDDVLVDSRWLVELVNLYATTKADLAGGRVLLWWKDVAQPDWAHGFALNMLSQVDHGDSTSETPSVVGANFTFRREVFARVGGFRKGLDRTPTSLMGGGESDFVRRAQEAGFRAFHCGASLVHHYVAPERLTPAYLGGVSEGFGKSLVYRKPTFGPRPALRSIVGHGYLIAKGTLMRVAGRVLGRPSTRFDGYLWQRVGRGGLGAAIDRLRGKNVVG